MAIFGSFYNEFDFEQLGTPENIDDFDQMKFCARLSYFNSKDRGNWFEKVSLQPIWFASKEDWKEDWHCGDCLVSMINIFWNHQNSWKSMGSGMFWIEVQWQKLQSIKIKFNPWSFENNSDFKQCFGSFFIDPILSKVIGVNLTQSIKTCFCSWYLHEDAERVIWKWFLRSVGSL